MTSLEGKMRHYSKFVSLFAVLIVIGYVFTPYSAIFLGLLIGLSAGFFNLWTTYSKAKVVGSVADKIGRRSSFSFVVAGLGFVIRIGIMLIALWIAVKFPDDANLFSVITGFALIYVIIIVDMLIQIVGKR